MLLKLKKKSSNRLDNDEEEDHGIDAQDEEDQKK